MFSLFIVFLCRAIAGLYRGLGILSRNSRFRIIISRFDRIPDVPRKTGNVAQSSD